MPQCDSDNDCTQHAIATLTRMAESITFTRDE